MATRIQHRRGTADQWASTNPVLAEGEAGFEIDTGVVKYGNGVDAWNDLIPMLESVISPTAAEWALNNPVLRDGVVGIARDTLVMKVGDGVTAWNDLPVTNSNEFVTKEFALSNYVSKGTFLVNVKDYGAVGNGTTDDTTAINNAISAAAGKTLYFPETTGSGYRTTSTVTIPAGIDVVMRADIVYAGPNGTTAVIINSANTPNSHRHLDLRVQRATRSDWTNEADIGLLIRNLARSTLRVHKVNGFTIGLQCLGHATGWVYNTVEIGDVYNCRYGVDLNSDAGGWCNENVFIGGSWQNQSSLNPTMTRHAIRIRSLDGYIQNANVFFKPSFEIGVGVTSGESIPVLITHGQYNAFRDCRLEGSGNIPIRTTGTSQKNVFTMTYSPSIELVSPDDIGSNPSSRVYGLAGMEFEDTVLVHRVNNVHKRAFFYSGGTMDVASDINVPGCVLWSSSDAVDRRNVAGLILSANYLELSASRGIGFYVDTSVVKRFVLDAESIAGYGGRFRVRCYDASGNVLQGVVGQGDDNVRGVSNKLWTYSSSYGGSYNTGSDANGPAYFRVGPNVAYIAVMCSGGTAPMRLKSFSLRTPSTRQPTVWTPYPSHEVDPVATMPPTAGTHQVGRRVWNAVPASGQPIGWVCTVAGTPGTWVPMSVLP